MPRRSICLDESPGWLRMSAAQKNRFQKDEILFGKLRPYFHKVGVAPCAGICSTDILVLTPTDSDWFGFAVGHLSSDELVEHASSIADGTRMPRVNWRDVARYEVALPPKSLAAHFSGIIRPWLTQIHHNAEESRALATLRDTLVPKLLSGEVRVGDSRFADGKPTA